MHAYVCVYVCMCVCVCVCVFTCLFVHCVCFNHILTSNSLIARLFVIAADEVQDVIFEKVAHEKAVQYENEQRLKQERLNKLFEDKKQARLDRLDSLRAEKAAAVQQKKVEKFQKIYSDEINAKLIRELDKIKRDRDADTHKYGLWEKKLGTAGNWTFSNQDPKTFRVKTDIYGESRKMLLGMKDDYSFDKYNDRWKNKTGSLLEIRWDKSDDFNIAEDAAVKVASEMDKALDFRDENDDELDGENLDDLFGDTSSMSLASTTTVSVSLNSTNAHKKIVAKILSVGKADILKNK